MGILFGIILSVVLLVAEATDVETSSLRHGGLPATRTGVPEVVPLRLYHAAVEPGNVAVELLPHLIVFIRHSHLQRRLVGVVLGAKTDYACGS
jgi:hypothetical protein